LSPEHQRTFIEQNLELMEKAVRFFDSLPYYAITTSAAHKEEFGEGPEANVTLIDDPFYVGQNVVDLFYLNSFFEFYFSEAPKFPPMFFKRQFQEQMFRGKNLYHYFMNPNNTMMGLLIAMTQTEMKPEEFREVLSQE
jgi:hypothetical protein